MPKFVIKKDKTKEPYQKEKVINSLKRIGADEETIDFILKSLDKNLPEIVTTKKLNDEIFYLLRKKEIHLSTRYNLKNAISLLGPAGYPFEKFFAKILHFYDYEVRTNLFLKGKCLSYEIDIYAKKNFDYLIECKFHQKFYKKNDIKTILYSYGRFIDLKENFPKSNLWIVTNTKFTSECLNFARCYQISLTSWNQSFFVDENKTLAELIEDKKLYPVTILTCCQQNVFKELIKFDIILVEDLLKKDKVFIKKITNLDQKTIDEIFVEAEKLIK